VLAAAPLCLAVAAAALVLAPHLPLQEGHLLGWRRYVCVGVGVGVCVCVGVGVGVFVHVRPRF